MRRAIVGRMFIIACIVGAGIHSCGLASERQPPSEAVNGGEGGETQTIGWASISDGIGRATVSDNAVWEAIPEEPGPADEFPQVGIEYDGPRCGDLSGCSESACCDDLACCHGSVRCDGLNACDGCCRQNAVCNRVYIIRGAAGWWPAIHTFLARLRRCGYEPDVYMFGGVNCAVDHLVERRRSGEEAGPVRIIGYSLGGHGAFNMARQLKDHGIVVDKLLLVECFSNPAISSNVRYCFNLYESRSSDSWLIFRGAPVTRESCCTHLVNINVACDPNWVELKSRNHFTMADDKRVHRALIHLLSCDCIWRRCDGRLCPHPPSEYGQP